MITTAETYHVTVLLEESVDGLDIQPGGIYADATFGGGGHSKEILRRLDGTGHLYAFDQDADAERNACQLKAGNFTFIRSNFCYMNNWMRYYGVGKLNGVIADLGVSSHHFDDAARGFSFRFDTQLDMRMNQRGGTTAADVVNGYDEEQLSTMFHLYGELKNSRRLAAAIVKARQQQRIETTGQLLKAVGMDMSADSQSSGGQWKKDGAKIFQALRIEVNREMEVLKEMLQAATKLLVPGGRLVVLTYHSLEDRIVKNMMRSGNTEGKMQQDFFGRVTAPLHIINNKVVTPSEEELAANPRSRSAKLRIAEKV